LRTRISSGIFHWEKFNELERAGLICMADDGRVVDLHWLAGIVQGTYETFNAAGDKHFGGD